MRQSQPAALSVVATDQADARATGEPAAAWLKVEEVAEILRLPISTTYDLVRTGVIPSVKLGRHRRIRRDALDLIGRTAR